MALLRLSLIARRSNKQANKPLTVASELGGLRRRGLFRHGLALPSCCYYTSRPAYAATSAAPPPVLLCPSHHLFLACIYDMPTFFWEDGRHHAAFRAAVRYAAFPAAFFLCATLSCSHAPVTLAQHLHDMQTFCAWAWLSLSYGGISGSPAAAATRTPISISLQRQPSSLLLSA